MAGTMTWFRADHGRIIWREFAGLAVENELQHLVGAERGGVDEFVAGIGHDRMRVAAGRDYLDRFRLDQSIFPDRAHRQFVATIGRGEQVRPV